MYIIKEAKKVHRKFECAMCGCVFSLANNEYITDSVLIHSDVLKRYTGRCPYCDAMTMNVSDIIYSDEACTIPMNVERG